MDKSFWGVMIMPTKMGKRLVGICSVAVTAIYTAGYIYTLPSVQAQASSVPSLSPTSNSTPGAAAAAHSASRSSHSRNGTSSSTSAKSGSSKSGTSTNGSSATSASSQSSKSSTKSSSKPPSKPAVKYKDGTYTGSGTNPYGSLSVSLTIAHGKIASVKITQWTMHYPQYVIDPQLPQEVVSMQTWQIYIVSGATASTYNFAQAVYLALQKAKA